MMSQHFGVALAAREGLGLEARVLRGRDPACRWTHLGVAYQAADRGTWHVVHADPGDGRDGRVRQDSFVEFAERAASARLMRLPVPNRETATRLRTEALRHVGMPFDGSYDWTRRDAMYCTSFLWRIFQVVGLPVPQPPFPRFALPMLGVRELILPSLFTQQAGDLWS